MFINALHYSSAKKLHQSGTIHSIHMQHNFEALKNCAMHFLCENRTNIFSLPDLIKTWPWPKFHKRDHTVGLFARKITFGTHQFLHLEALQPPPPTSAEEEFSENTHWLHCIHCLAVITIIFSHGVSIYLKQETPHFLIIGDRGGTGGVEQAESEKMDAMPCCCVCVSSQEESPVVIKLLGACPEMAWARDDKRW